MDYITCKKFWTILTAHKKVSQNKTVHNFFASEILTVQNNYSTVKNFEVTRSKALGFLYAGLNGANSS